MKQAFLLSVCIFFILGGVSGGKFTTTTSCQRCSISCGVQNCLKITGPNGYNSQICPGVSCDLSFSNKIDLDSCTTDSNGLACTTGVCFYSAYMSICNGGLDCTNFNFNSSIKCGPCLTKTCQACIIISSSLASPIEQCYPGTCSNFPSGSTTMQPCVGNIDSNGNTCKCCTKTVTSTQARYCTAQNTMFNSSSFTAYALKTSNGTLGDPKLNGIMLILLCLIWVIL